MSDTQLTRTIDFLNAITFLDEDGQWKLDLRTTLDAAVQRGNFTRVEDWMNAVCTVRRRTEGDRETQLAATLHIKQD